MVKTKCFGIEGCGYYSACVGFRLTSAKAVQELDKWKKIEHVNLVSLREMFTTKAFGDNCECEGREE